MSLTDEDAVFLHENGIDDSAPVYDVEQDGGWPTLEQSIPLREWLRLAATVISLLAFCFLVAVAVLAVAE